MSTIVRKQVLSWIALILGATLLGAAGIVFTPSPAPAEPTIRWSPSSVTETILAGETKTVPVSFTAAENLSNVNVRIVPELQPYVQLSPSSFASLKKGQTVNVSVVISAPATLLPGKFEGTIQLRNGTGKNQKIFANSLPATLNTAWPTFEGSIGAIRLDYPAVFEVQEGFPVNSSQSVTFLDNATGQGFTVAISSINTNELDIVTWADLQEWPFADNWRNHFTLANIAGITALQDPDTGSIKLTVGQLLYSITNGIGMDPVLIETDQFNIILASLEIFE